MSNTTIDYAYLAGVFDKRASFRINLINNYFSTKIQLNFKSEKHCLFFKQIIGGDIKHNAYDCSFSHRQVYYLLTLDYKLLDELLPKLTPFTLKRNISFYLEMRQLSGKNRSNLTTKDIEKREGFINRWKDYIRFD
jgi:hypothetical protein